MIDGAAVSRPLRLAVAACQYPAGVLDGVPVPHYRDAERHTAHFNDNPGPAYAAALRLARFLDRPGWDGMLVWCGDRIYIDATAGLFDPAQVVSGPFVDDVRRDDALRRPLRRDDALQRSLQRAYDTVDAAPFRRSAFPPRQAIDDHEIIDNWEPSNNPRRNAALLKRLQICRDAFTSRRPGVALYGNDPRDASAGRVFIVDTRTERSERDPAKLNKATIIGPGQWSALQTWLQPTAAEAGSPRLRVIASPSIVLPRRLATQREAPAAVRSDAWDGYPASLHGLLALLAEQRELRCLFVSGDEHLPCVVRATVRRADGSAPPVELISVHTGAMYAPYPFANSRPDDFSDEQCFSFGADSGGSPHEYQCRIASIWYPTAPGCGFGVGESAEQKRPLRKADGFTAIEFAADLCADPCIRYFAADGSDYVWTG